MKDSSRKIDIPMSSLDVKDEIGSARPIKIQEKDVSRFKSLVTAPLKGMAKGFVGMGELAYYMANPIAFLLPPKEAEVFESARKGIEKRMPTQPEFLEGALEKGGEVFSGLLTGGGSLPGQAARSAAAGLIGQGIEELGGGPLSQTAAQIPAIGFPSLARKIKPSSSDQKRILELGRRKGMSEKQLAPLMPETKKKRFFGRYASPSERAQESVKSTRESIGSIYESLSQSPEAKKILSPQDASKFAADIHSIGKSLPHAIRSQLKNDAADLVNAAKQKGGFAGEDLINFYHDVSSRYNLGRKELERFKGPIMKALEKIDPKLAKDFATTNRMYQKVSQIGRILNPSEYEHLVSLGEAMELGSSIATLDLTRLQRLLGIVGFRKFSEKMLTSPRLQNMIQKTQDALIKGNTPVVEKMGEIIKSDLRETRNQDQD